MKFFYYNQSTEKNGRIHYFLNAPNERPRLFFNTYSRVTNPRPLRVEGETLNPIIFNTNSRNRNKTELIISIAKTRHFACTAKTH